MDTIIWFIAFTLSIFGLGWTACNLRQSSTERRQRAKDAAWEKEQEMTSFPPITWTTKKGNVVELHEHAHGWSFSINKSHYPLIFPEITDCVRAVSKTLDYKTAMNASLMEEE